MKNKQKLQMRAIGLGGVTILFLLRFVAHLIIPEGRHIDLKPVYKRREEYRRLKALKILERDNYTK